MFNTLIILSLVVQGNTVSWLNPQFVHNKVLCSNQEMLIKLEMDGLWTHPTFIIPDIVLKNIDEYKCEAMVFGEDYLFPSMFDVTSKNIDLGD